jgi:16S rRNA (cytidine1402-2'-O)-methyltransferase
MTKRFEEVRRGSLAALAAQYAAEAARGEIAIVIGPAPEEATGEVELDRALRDAQAAGMSLRDAAAAVAAATGLPRKQVYRRALELGGGDGEG